MSKPIGHTCVSCSHSRYIEYGRVERLICQLHPCKPLPRGPQIPYQVVRETTPACSSYDSEFDGVQWRISSRGGSTSHPWQSNTYTNTPDL